MKKLIYLLLIFLNSHFSFSQNIGIGTSSPDSSAALEIKSSSQGFLPPRMTYAQRNAIANPAPWLIVCCTDCGYGGELQYFNGMQWLKFSTATASLPSYVTLSNGLIGYYPFNGNTNDESGNRYNGTAIGNISLIADRFGNSNSAYNFNGASYIHTNLLPPVGNAARSFSFWANGYAPFAVFSYGKQGYGETFCAGINCNTNNQLFYSSICDALKQVSIDINCNNWNFYTVVVPNGAQFQSDVLLYFNGNLLNSFTYYNANMAINTGSLATFDIGRLFYDPNFFFNGKLDDIRIYNRALTQDEITYLATH
jgi:hypothetical protein